MLKTNRSANIAAFAWGASKPAEQQSTGLVECAIFSLAGLPISLMLIAHGVFPAAMQLAALQ